MTETSRKSLDVLFVIGSLGIGGAERHVSRIARALIERGMNVAVYSLAGDGPLGHELEKGGVTVLVPPLGRARIGNARGPRVLRMMMTWVHLTYVMLRMRPEIAHFFLPAAYLVGAAAASLARVNIRVMSRRSLNVYQLSYPMMRWWEEKLHRKMNAVLGNSVAVVRQLHDNEGVPEGKLGLIYNGIDVPRNVCSRMSVRSSLGIDDQTLVFNIVANLIPYKGHLDLIKAFGIADKHIGTPWRLLVIGRDDGIEAELQTVARELGVADKISFLGLRSDVSNLMAASDVGLLSSHQEGFSNTVLEGMAAGLPMIVTDVGGNAEAVVNDETGLVVPPHDPHAFADAMLRLSHAPALRARYGAAGKSRVETHFTIDACAARYDALYRGLLQGKAPRDIPEVAYRVGVAG